MAGVVVVGAQWGDEGKGKIVDWLSSRADVVVRFQGGHNAGHTLVIDGKVFKLALLPSGLVRGGKLSVIGNGVVVDPWHMLEEIKGIQAQGVEVTPETLVLADNASLILPWHKDIDAAREDPAHYPHLRLTAVGRPAEMTVETIPGRWRSYYENIADALHSDAELAVKPESVRAVMAVIQAAQQSATTGQAVELEGVSGT